MEQTTNPSDCLWALSILMYAAIGFCYVWINVGKMIYQVVKWQFRKPTGRHWIGED
jgi:hypothetical protein